MTLVEWLLPSVVLGAACPLARMAALLLLFLFVLRIATELDRLENEEVGTPRFPSFRKAKTADGSNQRFEAQRRERIIMTNERIS